MSGGPPWWMDVTAHVVFCLLGLCLSVVRVRISRGAVEEQYRIFGVCYSERGPKIAFLLAGLLSVLRT